MNRNKILPYSTQSISKEDVDAVVNTLKSTFLTQGPKVPEFEKICKLLWCKIWSCF